MNKLVMTDLDERLKEALEGTDTFTVGMGQEYLTRIKQAFKDAGYATVRKNTYRDETDNYYTQTTLSYPDGSGEFIRVPQWQGPDSVKSVAWSQLKPPTVDYDAAPKDRFGEMVNPEDVHLHVCACGQTKTTRFMTGQEWYDRYKYELGQGSLDNLKDMPHSNDYSNGIDHAVLKCEEAAKRAAGLGEQDEQ